MSVPRDFTLTNAALAEDLADPSGRSVVKLTHEVIPASRFGQAGEDDEDEEDEEKEDDDVEMQTVVVTSLTAGKVSPKRHSKGEGRIWSGETSRVRTRADATGSLGRYRTSSPFSTLPSSRTRRSSSPSLDPSKQSFQASFSLCRFTS
jgi:hypothetical protein